MSDTTLQAIHDAIAAHLADENEDATYLTEWVVVTASALASEPNSTAYFYCDASIPYHHALGLLDWGRTFVKESRLVDILESDED